jgi:hypothetical protein
MNRGGLVANAVNRPTHLKLTINIDVSFRQITPLNSGFIKVYSSVPTLIEEIQLVG